MERALPGTFRGDMLKEVLFPHHTILGVVELVANYPALGPFCLGISVILSETILIPGTFSYLNQWSGFQLGTVPPKGHFVMSGDILVVVLGEWCYWHLLRRGQGCSKHPKMDGTAPLLNLHNKESSDPKCQVC